MPFHHAHHHAEVLAASVEVSVEATAASVVDSPNNQQLVSAEDAAKLVNKIIHIHRSLFIQSGQNPPLKSIIKF